MCTRCTDSTIDTDLMCHFKEMITHPMLKNAKIGIILSKIDLLKDECNFKEFAIQLGLFNANQNKLFIQGFIRKYTIYKQLSRHKAERRSLRNMVLDHIEFNLMF